MKAEAKRLRWSLMFAALALLINAWATALGFGSMFFMLP